MYGMYGDLSPVRAGVLDGLDHDYESRVALAAFKFGDPVMFDAGNETSAYVPDSTDASLVFGGVAVINQRGDNTSVGEYAIKDMVSVCTEGKIWVRVPDALSGCANKPAYVIDLIADGDYKKFTDTAGANTYDPGCYFRSNPITLGTGQTFAMVEVRGVK